MRLLVLLLIASPVADAEIRTVREILAPELRDAHDVLERLTELDRVFTATNDHRVVFNDIYIVTTRALTARLDRGDYEDVEWSEAFLVAFANFYRMALLNWESGNIDHVPAAWQIAFQRPAGSVLQDLLLGMNAHINHDLPRTVAVMGTGLDVERAHRDYLRVNETLAAVMDEMQRLLAAKYDPLLGILDELFQGWDEFFFTLLFIDWRGEAWRAGNVLKEGPAFRDYAFIDGLVNLRAIVLAHLIQGHGAEHAAPGESGNRVDALGRAP